jgi:DNA-directed RNA polymerase subunit RPC12/RpoP
MTAYECIECPQNLDRVSRGRLLEIDDDQMDPLFCPYCGNQTLIEGGVDWAALEDE